MKNRAKAIRSQRLQVVYVFSKNNQVYMKNNRHIKSLDDSLKNDKEWIPVNFQWKSLIKHKNNL